MENPVIFVKLSERTQSTAEMIERLNESYCEKVSRFYNTTAGDKAKMDGFHNGDTVLFVAILYDGDYISKAYLGNGEVNDSKNIYYKIFVSLPDNAALRNICKLSELDLEADFTPFLFYVESELDSRRR